MAVMSANADIIYWRLYDGGDSEFFFESESKYFLNHQPVSFVLCNRLQDALQ